MNKLYDFLKPDDLTLPIDNKAWVEYLDILRKEAADRWRDPDPPKPKPWQDDDEDMGR